MQLITFAREPGAGIRSLRTSRTFRHRGALLMVVGYTALIGAWVMASRPFTGPDEPAHYLRALTITNGHLLGPQAPNTLLGTEPAISSTGRAWQQRNSRGVLVPASLSPPEARCLDGGIDLHGSCIESTYTGDYPPLPYLLPAAALGVSNHVAAASWLARGASALPAIVFLALAIAVLWDGTVSSRLGLTLAITPMVLFVSSVVSPSGLQIAASAAFLASLLRIARAPDQPRQWVWVVAGVSGVVTILCWQLGPAFAAFDLVLFGLLLGRRGIAASRRSNTRYALAVCVLLVCALALYVGFAIASGSSDTTFGLHDLGTLHSGLDQLKPALQQAVGVFGRLDIPLPPAAQDLWIAGVVLLVVVAFVVAAPRRRVLLVGTCAVALLFPALFYAFVYRHAGFGLQGRYVLPVLMVVPLLAGELVHSESRRASVRIGAAAVAGTAAMQLIAWWVNARSSAGGRPGSIWFISHATWVPPLGWWPWTALAALGAALLALSAFADGIDPRTRI